jgi:glutamine synthetase
MRTTPEAISVLKDSKKTNVLLKTGVFKESEISTRHNVMLERYIKCREIELRTLSGMVLKQIVPVAVDYKAQLAESVKKQKELGADASLELELLKDLATLSKTVYEQTVNLTGSLDAIHKHDEETIAKKIASELMPQSFKIAELCNKIEEIIPDENWPLPKFYDMLFIR